MAKYYGTLGFARTVETSPGVWSPKVDERLYIGDITRNSRRWQAGQSINEDPIISVEVSFIADNYAIENIHDIKYVTHNGVKWKATRADYTHPRVVVMLGDVYRNE